jgi:hypothetical protein
LTPPPSIAITRAFRRVFKDEFSYVSPL